MGGDLRFLAMTSLSSELETVLKRSLLFLSICPSITWIRFLRLTPIRIALSFTRGVERVAPMQDRTIRGRPYVAMLDSSRIQHGRPNGD